MQAQFLFYLKFIIILNIASFPTPFFALNYARCAEHYGTIRLHLIKYTEKCKFELPPTLF
jgi:hypothetical protein